VAQKLWLLVAILLFGVPSPPLPAAPNNLPAIVARPGQISVGSNRQIDGLPGIIRRAGPKAAERTLEFFFAQIRNPNTRRAYAHAAMQFFTWCETRSLELAHVTPLAVAAYVEELNRRYAAPTAKQHLAAIRMLFDWLVVGQVMPMNPAASVRGPKHVVRRGKTPVLTAEQARTLIDSIETDGVAGLRDRALIGVMVYTFARVGAAAAMRVEDYYPSGKRWWFRLHEKGSKRHDVPAHHNAEAYMDAYIEAAGIADDKRGPLFRTLGRDRQLTARSMTRTDILRMIKRRAAAAGLPDSTCCHTFRATGITAYLENGGTVEKAQQIAAHESPRTTKLYDRTNDELTLDEIERIQI
jgi:site-specific recombinase XerD